MATTWSPLIATSPMTPGAPLPSNSVPPFRTTSASTGSAPRQRESKRIAVFMRDSCSFFACGLFSTRHVLHRQPRTALLGTLDALRDEVQAIDAVADVGVDGVIGFELLARSALGHRVEGGGV